MQPGDEELRQLIINNGYVSTRAVERLHAAGCGSIAMFYMMSSDEVLSLQVKIQT